MGRVRGGVRSGVRGGVRGGVRDGLRGGVSGGEYRKRAVFSLLETEDNVAPYRAAASINTCCSASFRLPDLRLLEKSSSQLTYLVFSFNRAVNILNSFPAHVVGSDDIDKFKN